MKRWWAEPRRALAEGKPWGNHGLSSPHRPTARALAGSGCAWFLTARLPSLHPFVEECVEPGSCIHTDGWQGYAGLETKGYQREITKLSNQKENASTLMPRVHSVASLLKRWLLGTHQGGVAYYYLPYYLDEFTFRFNRRKSASRGKLFFRLMQQAVSTPPRTHESMVRSDVHKPQPVGVG
jgi:hypothetical protein